MGQCRNRSFGGWLSQRPVLSGLPTVQIWLCDWTRDVGVSFRLFDRMLVRWVNGLGACVGGAHFLIHTAVQFEKCHAEKLGMYLAPEPPARPEPAPMATHRTLDLSLSFKCGNDTAGSAAQTSPERGTTYERGTPCQREYGGT